jgi:hypothetical protein
LELFIHGFKRIQHRFCGFDRTALHPYEQSVSGKSGGIAGKIEKDRINPCQICVKSEVDGLGDYLCSEIQALS